ncbi:hypothetical protein M9194_20130 [Vibrio sp. S4M6]|uniref:hypothetical protein n=1 Tax=Vibrio sinus TaxID=2946865 RepID=UPI00202A2383|nr:hypothetical protein [Vibrio sinus]MCL9783737.1 hypothetical protein [Vibrio sinus]
MNIFAKTHSSSKAAHVQHDSSHSDDSNEQAFGKLLKKQNSDEESMMMGIFQGRSDRLMEFISPWPNNATEQVQSLKRVGSVYQSDTFAITRVSIHSLHVKLLSGPMIGLELQASLSAGRVQIALKAKQADQYQSLKRCMSHLAHKANLYCSYSVDIHLEPLDGR